MIRYLSKVFLKWSIKLDRYAAKLEGKVDNTFTRIDKEIDRIKKDIKSQL
jgi:hypothetical protein